MALYARTRRGTSASFWRNYNNMQEMLTGVCMQQTGQRAGSMPVPPPTSSRVPVVPVPVLEITPGGQPLVPVWVPTPEQRLRYQARRKAIAA